MPHPLDLIVGEGASAKDLLVRRLVSDMALDAVGGGVLRNSNALRAVSNVMREPTTTARAAVQQLLPALEVVEANGFGLASAYSRYSAPVLERLSLVAGRVTSTERQFLAVVIAAVDTALVGPGIETAIGVAALGCDLTLAVANYAVAVGIELSFGPPPAELEAARREVRERARRAIASGAVDYDEIVGAGTSRGLTEPEAAAALELSLMELRDAKAALFGHVRQRLAES